MSLLTVEALDCQFGGVHAIAALSFSLKAGGIHSIIGPNGAGKTTLFNLITGVYRPNSGCIRFQDRNITGLPPHVLARRGLVRTFQNLQVFPEMTVLESVMVGRHLHIRRGFFPSLLRLPGLVGSERACADQARGLLERVGLAGMEDCLPGALPYGALKRLELARALAAEPVLLLLDEPAAGCNPTETREIDTLIRQIAEDGVTVVLVEHDMRLVMEISDHIFVLDHGQLLAEGRAEAIRHNPAVIAAYLGQAAAEAGTLLGGEEAP